MTMIKLCGLRRDCDIDYANELLPEYIGFVFAKNSKRYVAPDDADILRRKLHKSIIPVGVFVDERVENIVNLLDRHIVEAVQLHGNEGEDYIRELRRVAQATIIKAFRVKSVADIEMANASSADYVLLDSGGGTGEAFDWSFIKKIERPYFLAGGLTPSNVGMAIKELHPFGVDASTSLEAEGWKDKSKMVAFVRSVRQ